MKNSRFGVKAYHNPEILASMKELEPEMEIIGLTEAAGLFSATSSYWEGTAGDLYKELSEHRAIEIQKRLSGICKSSIGLGRKLARLIEIAPHLCACEKGAHNKTFYTLRHPYI